MIRQELVIRRGKKNVPEILDFLYLDLFGAAALTLVPVLVTSKELGITCSRTLVHSGTRRYGTGTRLRFSVISRTCITNANIITAPTFPSPHHLHIHHLLQLLDNLPLSIFILISITLHLRLCFDLMPTVIEIT
jgi:hypothetical protein